MSGKESRNSQHNLFHVFIFCLILLAVVLLLIHKRAEDGRQLESAESEATEVIGVETEELVANDILPEDQAAVDTEPESATVETPPPKPPAETPVEMEREPDLPDATASLGRYFTFSSDLDLKADSLSCQSVFDVISGGKSLEEVRANYQIYRDESLPLAERLAADDSIFYDYIVSFEAYLNDSNAKQPADDALEYLDLYQECRLELTAKNTGSPRTLNSGCGLSFFRSVSLLDVRERVISPHDFRPILCTRAIVSFPSGATDPDIQYFVLPVDTELAAIVFDNRNRQGIEAVIAVPNL